MNGMLLQNPTAQADAAMDGALVRKLWKSFSLNGSELLLTPGRPNTFVMGEVSPPALPEGKEFALLVTEDGAAVTGANFGGLMRGFFSLLMKLEADGKTLRLPPCREESGYTVPRRMLHLCVFPENDLYFIRKMLRLAALCQYTHVVLEFWGTLQYDCLHELAWPGAYSKSQARELIAEIRALGMEPVPMFNQLGHATASRACYGKHVVLDQNPALQYLFTPDGWAWDIASPEVRNLLRNVRAELYELFGPGEYLHIGCDEAYFYTRSPMRTYLPDWLRELTGEVVREGRRPMVWMDMLLEKGQFPNCTASCAPEDAEMLRSALHPQTVLVDWQYHITEAPVPTSVYLQKTGYDVMCAPWLDRKNYLAHCETAREYGLFGIMQTTWHTLKEQAAGVLGCAEACGASLFPWGEWSQPRLQTAALLRRVGLEGNCYADCGWSKTQIEV